MNKDLGIVILAAGEGTRMKSSVPKVLFSICGKSIIEHVIQTALDLSANRVYVVVGHKKEEVKNKVLGSFSREQQKKIVFVVQEKQLGSGHAVLQVKDVIDRSISKLLVLSGDVPLITEETLKKLLLKQQTSGVDCCVLSVEVENPFSYGRIVRDKNDKFVDIVEEKDANFCQRQIKEVNSGIYVFKLPSLWESLKKVKPENKKKEYYLTDVVRYSNTKDTLTIKDEIEVKGINTRYDLAGVEEIVRKRLLKKFMLEGVSVVMPESVYVDYYTKIGVDSVIYPGCVITSSVIGENCFIGPYSEIKNSYIDDGTKVIFSYIEGSKIGKNCKIGPYSRIRPTTNLIENVSVGNFVEVKNSVIKNGSKINHLSYVGDAEIEERVNVGAGTITCNYDGIKKYNTFIGKDSFIGSNTNLIAPIKVGNNVVIAAGSTVSKDVLPYTLVIERSQEIHKHKHRIVKKLYNKKISLG